MITLNFTSPEQRDANQFQKNYRIIQSVMIVSVITLVIISAVLFISQIILQEKLDTITADTLEIMEQVEDERSLNLSETVQGFNSLLGNVSKIQTEYSAWSNILIEISGSTTNGVIINSINLQKSNSSFQFSGIADTRDSLLAFKTNLEQSPFFNNIESPISNLLTKENISFSLTGEIILDPKIVFESL